MTRVDPVKRAGTVGWSEPVEWAEPVGWAEPGTCLRSSATEKGTH